MKLFLHWIWAPLILIIVVTIPFYEAFTSQHPIGSNYPDTDLDYFLRMHHANFKANTVFPQWNPIDICGSPVRSEIQSGVFYPPNILFRWFPLFKAVSLYFWVHSLLLALFTYGLARNLFLSKPASIISAVTLTFCGHCILGIYAGKLSNIATITWIPLQLSLISQLNQKHNTRIYLSMGIVFAIQFFAGHFQYMYYSFIFVFFYYQYVIIQYTGRLKYQLGIICAILIGGIICLPQVLPVVDYVQETSRVNMTLSQSGQFSFPLENLLTILFPGIFGDMQHSLYWGAYNLWEMCAFCGIIPFLLCCMAIRNVSRRFVYFIVAGMISLIIALGANTPLFQLLYNFVPGISLFRGHSKAISIFCICIALLAGKGFDTIESTKTNNCRKKQWTIFISSACILLFVCQTPICYHILDTWMTYTINNTDHYLPIQSIRQSSLMRCNVINKSIAGISKQLLWVILGLWILYQSKYWTKKMQMGTIVLAVIIEMTSFASFYIQTVDSSHFQMNASVADFFKQDLSIYRILDLRQQPFEPVSNLQTITGDRPYIWDRYTRLINLFVTGHPFSSMKLPVIQKMHDGFNMLNVKYILMSPNSKIPCTACIRRYSGQDADIYENTNCLPRAFFAKKVKLVENSLPFMGTPEVVHGDIVVLEKKSHDMDIHRQMNANVQIVTYTNDYVRLHTQTNVSGWLILNDIWHDGWEVVCDGELFLDLYIANYIFRAVYVSEGEHIVEFIYGN